MQVEVAVHLPEVGVGLAGAHRLVYRVAVDAFASEHAHDGAHTSLAATVNDEHQLKLAEECAQTLRRLGAKHDARAPRAALLLDALFDVEPLL